MDPGRARVACDRREFMRNFGSRRKRLRRWRRYLLGTSMTAFPTWRFVSVLSCARSSQLGARGFCISRISSLWMAGKRDVCGGSKKLMHSTQFEITFLYALQSILQVSSSDFTHLVDRRFFGFIFSQKRRVFGEKSPEQKMSRTSFSTIHSMGSMS